MRVSDAVTVYPSSTRPLSSSWFLFVLAVVFLAATLEMLDVQVVIKHVTADAVLRVLDIGSTG